MADTKITGLQPPQPGYAIVPSTDVLPIVVIADPGMAASGSTRKATVNQILGAGGTATLASATITGDLTVDTNVLKVDSANNRVGINFTSPTVPLYVQGSNATATAIMQDETNGAKLRLLANSINFDLSNGGGGGDIAVSGANPLTFRINGSEQMRLNSTGLGVGVTPGQKLDVVSSTGCVARIRGGSGSGQSAAFYVSNTAGTSTLAAFGDGANMIGGTVDSSAMVYAGASIPLVFYINSAERMRIDASGNVGVGVTPSAWGAGFKAIQVNGGASMMGDSANAYFGANNYYDGTNFIYSTNNGASRFELTTSGIKWYTAPSGTAGNAITFTQAMTLDASGNLLVGPTSPHLTGRSAFQNNQTGQVTFRNSSATAGRSFYIGMDSGSSMQVANESGVGVYMVHGGTSWLALSDERLKDIIEPISNAVAKIGSLRSVIGKFKTDSEGTRRSFLIAQDVQSVLPEAVDSSNPDKIGLAYSEVIPLLVAAIKELTARVQTLEAK